jgi:hypothetical protein
MEIDEFNKFKAAMPEHLRLTVTYLYFTGSRTGEMRQITWGMIWKDCTEINIPAKEVRREDAPLCRSSPSRLSPLGGAQLDPGWCGSPFRDAHNWSK